MRFEKGPASVVRLSSRMIFLKLRVMTGVGRAQPMRHEGKMEADERAEDDESGKQKGPDGIDVAPWG